MHPPGLVRAGGSSVTSGSPGGRSPSPSCELPLPSCQEVGTRISSHTPLIIQFFMLKTFGQLRKGMPQLLQNKDKYDRLLERSDTSDRRKLPREPLQRLTRARLAKFPG